MCEDRNGEILTSPNSDLWADRDRRIFLVVPKGQDFGFAFDGAALIRVTDLRKGPEIDRGIARARRMLMAAADKVPGGIPRMTRTVARPSEAPGGTTGSHGAEGNEATDGEWTALELRRLYAVSDPATVSMMKRYAEAAALLVAGKRGGDMVAPEPLVQVGF